MLDLSQCKYCLDKKIICGKKKTIYICKEDKEQRAIEFIDECPKKKKKEGDLVLWQE